MANSTSTAAAAAAAAKANARKLRQLNNENSTRYFAAGVGGMIALFILFHWTNVLYQRYGRSKKGTSTLFKIPVAISRSSRSILIRKIPGFPSLGHNIIFLAYVGINVAVTFTKIDWSTLAQFAKRLGWTAVANLCVVMFLSMKNTPLAILTKQSYERLQPMHQISGYTAIGCMFMHAMVYIASWAKSHNLHELLEVNQINGIVSGLAMLSIIPLYLILSRKSYELFYITHLILAMLILITGALHRPKLTSRSTYGIVFCASLWGLDRVIRYLRLGYYSISNTASLIALPHGGTKMVIKKAPLGTKAGTHVFVYLPSIRGIEMHPFTVVGTSGTGLELVMAARDGFTGDVYRRAIAGQSEGKEVVVKASVEGPYGCVPDLKGVDKVVFISGGSGGSFNVAVAVEFMRTLGEGVSVDFVWVVRYPEMLAWYQNYLDELSSSPVVNLRVHVTHPHHNIASDASSTSSSPTPSSPLGDIEKAVPSSPAVEKFSQQGAYTLHHGRPDIPSLISDTVKSAQKSDKVAIVACGPNGMMLQIRKEVADNIRVEGPALEFHGEAFGW